MITKSSWAVITLFCCAAVDAVRGERNEGAVKKAWEWSLEERITARRNATPVVDGHPGTGDSIRTNGSVARFVIDGRRNPELFLTHELMALLLDASTPDSTATMRTRAGYESKIRDLGWEPAVFWRDLDMASVTYATISRSAAGEPTTEQNRAICAARFNALIAMRAKYRRFDEFLYRAVASRSALGSDAPPTEQWLTWLEGGCR